MVSGIGVISYEIKQLESNVKCARHCVNRIVEACTTPGSVSSIAVRAIERELTAMEGQLENLKDGFARGD